MGYEATVWYSNGSVTIKGYWPLKTDLRKIPTEEDVKILLWKAFQDLFKDDKRLNSCVWLHGGIDAIKDGCPNFGIKEECKNGDV
jgi:hypothetical protein